VAHEVDEAIFEASIAWIGHWRSLLQTFF